MLFFEAKGPSSSAQRRRRRTALWSAPVTILVSSTLVINACHAAPQRLPALDEQRLMGRPSFSSPVSSQIQQAVVDSAGQMASPQWKQNRPAEIFVQTATSRALSDGDGGGTAARSLSPHKIQRRSYTVSTATGKNVVVPSSFASTIASSWDPRQRSVWFQRKAVIITSVFLAILIVLIIGAAAFIRDKREEDAEDEVDVSDEAALKRMREEREMRNAGRHSKDKKGTLTKRETSGSGHDQAGCGASTAIVYRWAKIPTRKLRKKKTRSLRSPSRVSVTSQELELTPQSSGNRNTGETDGGQLSSQEAHTSLSSSSGLQRTSTESVRNRQTSSATRENLSAADVTAVDAVMERQLNSDTLDETGDAFPPAYIASHARAAGQLHPSADRRLAAGQAATSSVAATAGSTSASEKQPMPSDFEANSEGEPSALPPAIEDITPPQRSGSDNHYSAHIATDDKTMLGQLQNAASTPGGVPSMPQGSAASDDPNVSEAGSASALQQASAPTLDDAHHGDEDLTEEELRQIGGSHASGKEKGKSSAVGASAASTSSLLPAPPTALAPSAFNPFDTPYNNGPAPLAASLSSNGRSAPDASSEKAREAEEEQRKALTLMESKPDDMAHLPVYESTPSAPSAPPPVDGDEDEEENYGKEDADAGAEAQHGAPPSSSSVTPSAPPL